MLLAMQTEVLQSPQPNGPSEYTRPQACVWKISQTKGDVKNTEFWATAASYADLLVHLVLLLF